MTNIIATRVRLACLIAGWIVLAMGACGDLMVIIAWMAGISNQQQLTIVAVVYTSLVVLGFLLTRVKLHHFPKDGEWGGFFYFLLRRLVASLFVGWGAMAAAGSIVCFWDGKVSNTIFGVLMCLGLCAIGRFLWAKPFVPRHMG